MISDTAHSFVIGETYISRKINSSYCSITITDNDTHENTGIRIGWPHFERNTIKVIHEDGVSEEINWKNMSVYNGEIVNPLEQLKGAMVMSHYIDVWSSHMTSRVSFDNGLILEVDADVGLIVDGKLPERNMWFGIGFLRDAGRTSKLYDITDSL